MLLAFFAHPNGEEKEQIIEVYREGGGGAENRWLLSLSEVFRSGRRRKNVLSPRKRGRKGKIIFPAPPPPFLLLSPPLPLNGGGDVGRRWKRKRDTEKQKEERVGKKVKPLFFFLLLLCLHIFLSFQTHSRADRYGERGTGRRGEPNGPIGGETCCCFWLDREWTGVYFPSLSSSPKEMGA